VPAFTDGVPFKNKAIIAEYPSARLAVQAAFGADLAADEATWTWTDITTDVRQNDGNIVNITPMGRSDESTTAQPAGVALVLDNTSGDYSAYHPASPHYPYVRRNTPIRVLVNLTGDTADTSTRFFGYANGWPMSWQDDGTARISVVNLTTSGETRRLKQGKTKARSAIRRYLDTAANVPAAYWPLEDDSAALVASSALPGGAPMVASGGGAAGKGVKFGVAQGRVQAAYTGFEVQRIGVKSFVSLAEGGTLTAPLPAGSGTTYTVQFIAFSWAYTGFTGDDIVLARWYTPGGSFVRYDVRQESLDGGTFLVGFNSAGAETKLADIAFALVDEFVHTITIAQNGANVDTTFTAARVTSGGAFTGTDTDSRAGTFALPVGDIILNPDGTTADGSAIAGSDNQKRDIRLGQLAVWYGTHTAVAATATDSETGLVYSPWGGYVGQNGAARLQRLADEHGIALTVAGTSSQAMGFLDVGTFLDLARETETSDGGLLLDGFGQGYLYVTRGARYNQGAALTISAVAAQLAPPLGPQDNDQRDVNVFVATRKDGGSATYEDEDGPKGTAAIGTYGSSGTFNLADEDPLLDYASWAVHLGTVEGYRYPSMTLDFTARSVAPLAADWLTVLPSYLVEVTNPSAVFAKHPPGDIGVLVEGWGEQISPYVWRATLNCSPAPPWQVGELDGDNRLDCGGSTLNEDLDATETGIDVLITDSCAWAHDDGDYVIVVGGEEMTVTAVGVVSGSVPSRTQTLTVVRSVNGIVKTHDTGDEVHVRDPIILAL
jgi:hypothetical protein